MKKNISSNKMQYAFILLSYIGSYLNNDYVLLLSLVYFIVLLIFVPIEQCLIVFIKISPLFMITLDNVLIYPYLLIIPIFKMIPKIKLNFLIVIYIFLLGCIIFYNDFGKFYFSNMLIYLNIIFLILFVNSVDLVKIYSIEIIDNLIITNVIFLLFTVVTGEVIFMHARLGAEFSQFGGSMGIPLNALILICCSYLKYFRYERNYKMFWMLFTLSFIVGLLTISRVFILGLCFFIICLIIDIKENKRSFFLFFFLILFFFSLITIFFSQFNYLLTRGETDISTGRFDIYASILTFLFSNVSDLLFGTATGYATFLSAEYPILKMSAHNLFLELIMQFGLVGFLCIVYIVTNGTSLKKIPKEYFRTSFTEYIPLIVYISSFLVSGSIYYTKTIITFIALFLIKKYKI